MAQIPQNCLARKKINHLIANKDSKKGFVEGGEGRMINVFLRSENKQTGKGKLKMTKVNQNPHIPMK